MSNYLDTLNPSQREAVVYCDGPQLVIAGAGSGKTRVLTMKIAYLLQHGYNADEIIALTFTKKAATEMKSRIRDLVGPGLSRRLWMGTFHSLFSRILRREATRLGFKQDFTIYDQSDSRSLVKSIIKEMGLDDKTYKPNGIQAQISNAKNNLITPGMYRANRELMQYDERAKRPMFADIYQTYWNRCYQAGAMDFDDLLIYTNILFRDFPDVLEYYQNYFKYVLVDEYQDTNRAQHLIVEQLVRQHKHLTVVGDDAQSIYSFRGANIRNILDLRSQIPGTKLFKLEQNYRSTRNIVDAANSLIKHNRQQIPKTIFSEKEHGNPLSLTGTYSDLEESYVVASRIAELHDVQGYNYSDCAILYRTNAQSRNLEESLRKRGIEYRIFGGLSFYQRKEIKDIIAYLRLITNTADEEAFKRIINYPGRGIGDTTVSKIAAVRDEHNTLFDICRDPLAHGVSVNKGTAGKLIGFATLIEHFQQLNTQLNAYELTERVITESGIKADLNSGTTIEEKSRRENVEELLSAIQTFIITCAEEGNPNDKLIDFLADVSLSGDIDPAEENDGEEKDYVALMTIHQAKGLEFKNVFIVGVEENLIPSDMSINEPGGLEEERRLFYVAITRAEENCFLSYSRSRFRNGRSEPAKPSRFLKDIDRQYIKQSGIERETTDYGSSGGGDFVRPFGNPFSNEDLSSHRTAARSTSGSRNKILDFTGRVVKVTPEDKPNLISHAPSSGTLTVGGKKVTVGTRIEHNRFGKGTIKETSGSGENARLVVNFDNCGDKTLLLKFASITVIS